ncbi:hypothetical protein BH10ACT8_BH10ACT8_28140 [soil metagenome]
MLTTMWEVKAAEGCLDELLDWVRPRLDPTAQLYRSAGPEPRVVVIDPTGQAATTLAELPAAYADRPPHAWDFDRL